jgi:hypothetical protein
MDGEYDESEGVPHLVYYWSPFKFIVAYVNRLSLAKITTTDIGVNGMKPGVTAGEDQQKIT